LTALLTIAVLFAAAGIPVAIVAAIWTAWRSQPYVGEGIGFWSLVIGFTINEIQLFTVLFGIVGLLFGLLISRESANAVASRPRRTGALWGAVAGLAAGVLAYHFGRWGSGATPAVWWSGALTLGALCAVSCGGLATLFLHLAASDKLLRGEQGESRGFPKEQR
jgi:hypothetical protein